MTTITIPKNLTQRGELVLIPRKEYERFLRVQKDKAFYEELDRDLDKAIQDYKKGKYYGPFKTAKEGIRFLKSRKLQRE